MGASRVGGFPNLPQEMLWPTWKEKPLDFLAQIRLTDVARLDADGVLPSSGLLYFFFATNEMPWGQTADDRAAWRVLYSDTTRGLERSRPLGIEESEIRGMDYPTCSLRFFEEWTVPSWESHPVLAMELQKDEEAAYYEVEERVRETNHPEPINRLLGHPDQIQGDMLMECEIRSQGFHPGNYTYGPGRSRFKAKASAWRLLLQLDSDDQAGFMFPTGQLGRLYFWIREHDLRDRNFENAWAIMQWS